MSLPPVLLHLFMWLVAIIANKLKEAEIANDSEMSLEDEVAMALKKA